MTAEIRDYVSVAEKLKQFNTLVPAELALLPDNLAFVSSKEELRQHVESDTVRTLLLSNAVPHAEIFDENNQPAYLQQYGYEWFGPSLFVSAGLLAQNPEILSITLGLITNYLYDLFRGEQSGTASLSVVVQKNDGSCKEVRYKGPPSGLNSIADIVKELNNE